MIGRISWPILCYALVATFLVVYWCPAQAHDRTTSYSFWNLSERQAEVVLRINRMYLPNVLATIGAASSGDTILASYLVDNLRMLAGNNVCAIVGEPQWIGGQPELLTLRWNIECPDKGMLIIHSDLLLETRSGHLHFVNLKYKGQSAERVLSDADRSWILSNAPDARDTSPMSSSIVSYLLLGVEHIATGYDHLVFLLALLLTGGTLISLVKTVTGFTVGHSVTLGLATFGVIRPEIGSIEALIGLSIMLVALENVWLLGRKSYYLPMVIVLVLMLLFVGSIFGYGQVSSLSFLGFAIFAACYYAFLQKGVRAESGRWALALIFGFIHGCAFASVLISARIPVERLPVVLLSFNLGVEAGQLVVAAMVWPLLRIAISRWGAVVIEGGSAVTLGLGSYWMVGRNYAVF
jgi:hypothetical protein